MISEFATILSPDEVMPLKRAAEEAQRDSTTMKRWVKKYGIGRHAGSNERSIPEFSRVDCPARLKNNQGFQNGGTACGEVTALGLSGCGKDLRTDLSRLIAGLQAPGFPRAVENGEGDRFSAGVERQGRGVAGTNHFGEAQ